MDDEGLEMMNEKGLACFSYHLGVALEVGIFREMSQWNDNNHLVSKITWLQCYLFYEMLMVGSSRLVVSDSKLKCRSLGGG